jgi:hypothetical protein
MLLLDLCRAIERIKNSCGVEPTPKPDWCDLPPGKLGGFVSRTSSAKRLLTSAPFRGSHHRSPSLSLTLLGPISVHYALPLYFYRYSHAIVRSNLAKLPR